MFLITSFWRIGIAPESSGQYSRKLACFAPFQSGLDYLDDQKSWTKHENGKSEEVLYKHKEHPSLPRMSKPYELPIQLPMPV